MWWSLPNEPKTEIRKLRPGQVVIDVGSHVGVTSLMFARPECRVVAIKSNPHAFRELQRSTNGNPTVMGVWAVATVGGGDEVPLHMINDSAMDPLAFTQGSSLKLDRINVIRAVKGVSAFDLPKIIEELGSVSIMKVENEGYEVNLLPWLVESGALQRVASVLAETHETKWPALVSETQIMRDECESPPGIGESSSNSP